MPLLRRVPAAVRTPGVQPAEPEPGAVGASDAESDSGPARAWLEPSAPVVIVSQASASASTGLTGIGGLPAVGENGELEFASPDYMTPVYRLVNPETGSRVTLVANIHIGEPAYFRGLKSILVELEAGGATIHCERIRPPTDEQVAAAPDALRRLHELYWQPVDQGGGSYSSVGVVDKGAVLKPEPDSWEAHDVTSLELLEFLGPAAGKAWIENMRGRAQLRHAGPDVVRADLRKFFMNATGAKLRARIHRTEWGMDEMLRIALYREAVAWRAVDLHLARDLGSDLGLCWGEGHMPGFLAGFGARGYKVESEQWLSAISASIVGL